MSRCDSCGGEDCACCEVYLEQKHDIKYGQFYEDDDFNPLDYFFSDEDDEDDEDWEDEEDE